jgi:hypothetical protein
MSYTQILVTAEAQYQYSVYHEGTSPTYYEGGYIGKVLISQGQDGYYEDKWSDVYTLKVHVLTGEDVNELLDKIVYDETALICFIKWSNGGSSLIEVNNYTTQDLIFSEDGLKEKSLTGYDDEERYWEIIIP